MNRKRYQGVLVLYVEDDPDVRDVWLDYIRKQHPKAIGVGSYEEAMDLLEEGAIPDLAILDRSILRYVDDDLEQPSAGDALYMELINRDVPVAVLSADPNLEHKDPYYSHPPKLGLFAKDNTELELNRAFENFHDRQAKS